MFIQVCKLAALQEDPSISALNTVYRVSMRSSCHLGIRQMEAPTTMVAEATDDTVQWHGTAVSSVLHQVNYNGSAVQWHEAVKSVLCLHDCIKNQPPAKVFG